MQYTDALCNIVIDNATNAVVIASTELLRLAGIAISGRPILEHAYRRGVIAVAAPDAIHAMQILRESGIGTRLC